MFDSCVRNRSAILSSGAYREQKKEENLAANHTNTWQPYSCIQPRNRRGQLLHKRRKMPNDVQAQCFQNICERPGEAKERTD